MFLIILGVLIFSILFSKYLAFSLTPYSAGSEGFVSFNSANASGSTQTLTNYSTNTITSVYDNVYFDTKTGNIIEVVGIAQPTAPDANGNVNIVGNVIDVGGNTITSLYVNPRMIPNQPVRLEYASLTPSDIITSPTTSLEAYDAFTYNTNVNADSSDKYAVIYIPWNQDTYIHVIGVSGIYASKNIVSQYYNGSTGLGNNIVSFIGNGLGLLSTAAISPVPGNPIPSPLPLSLSTTIPRKANTSDLTDLSLNSSDTIYYINNNVLYDATIGVVVINKKYYNITNGSAIAVTAFPTTFPSPQNTSLTSWMVTDGACVLGMSIGYNTVIAVLKPDYKIATLARFANSNQTLETTTNAYVMSTYSTGEYPAISGNTISGNASPSSPSPSPSPSPSTTTSSNKGNKGSEYDFSSFNKTCGSDISQWSTTCLQNFFMMSQDYTIPTSQNDYILKTQIVPPVCPTCPNCPNSGVCTSCGGQGGSGTTGNSGSSGVTVGTTVSNGNLSTNANQNTVGGAVSTTALGAVAGAENIASTGVNAAGNLANNVVNSASGLVSGAGTGAKDLLTGVGTGVKDLISGAGTGVKDFVSGTNQFVRDAASGAVNTTGKAWNELTESDKNDIDRNGYYNSNSNSNTYSVNRDNRGYNTGTDPVSYKNAGVDTYSYYGALPTKGSSNFMPVTADFSTFRK